MDIPLRMDTHTAQVLTLPPRELDTLTA